MRARNSLVATLSFLRRVLGPPLSRLARLALRAARSSPAVTAAMLSVALLAAAPALRAIPGWANAAGFALAPTAPAQPAVAGLDVRLLYRADPGAGVGARWAEIPGNAPFNDELRRVVREAIDAQAAATGVAYAPAADAPAGRLSARACAPDATIRPAAELLRDPGLTPQTGGPTVTVVCEIVAASGSVLGEALRIVTASAGQVLSDTTRVVYTDTANGLLGAGDALVSDGGMRDLVAQLVNDATGAQGQLPVDLAEAPLPQLRTWFSNIGFGPDGSLVLRVPDGFAPPDLPGAAELAGAAPSVDTEPLVLTVAPPHTAPLLTDLGHRIRSALTSDAPLALPAPPLRSQEAIDCGFFACLALTYDDGPGPHTGEVLDALAARRAAGTFFLQGVNAERYPDLVRRMQAEGHQIGNHTWSHADLTKLTAEQVTEQIERTNAVVSGITGTAPTTFRPPYGAVNDAVLARVPMPAILWSQDTRDWTSPGDAALLERAIAGPRPGDIVLFHDVHESSARLTLQIVDGLLDRGFTLVTVDQLLGGTPAAGTIVRR